MKFYIVIFLSMFLTSACEVSVDQADSKTGTNNTNTKWKTGGSQGSEYFTTGAGAYTYNSPYGLWRGDAFKSGDTVRTEAFYIESGTAVAFAVQCLKYGMEAYAVVSAPVNVTANGLITVKESRGYEAEVKNEKSGQKIKCAAELQAGQMYYSIENGDVLCMSSEANCSGSRSKFDKIKDKM